MNKTNRVSSIDNSQDEICHASLNSFHDSSVQRKDVMTEIKFWMLPQKKKIYTAIGDFNQNRSESTYFIFLWFILLLLIIDLIQGWRQNLRVCRLIFPCYWSVDLKKPKGNKLVAPFFYFCKLSHRFCSKSAKKLHLLQKQNIQEIYDICSEH